MILPTPNDDFAWRQTAFGPALVCTALAAHAPHVFTTRTWRLGRPASPDAWSDIASALDVPAASLARLKQVHRRTTHVAVGAPQRSAVDPLPEADIVITGDASLAVAVQAADCVPLLIADRRLGVVAAAHAGWRGLALGVPGEVVAALGRTFGSHASDLIVAVGPSIGACCYEVGDDVRQAFIDGGAGPAQIARWFMDAPAAIPGNPSMPGLPAATRPGHAYFDGWTCARDQLQAAGLDAGMILSSGLCTASHPEVLCSYRREGARAGRIVGAIRPSRRP